MQIEAVGILGSLVIEALASDNVDALDKVGAGLAFIASIRATVEELESKNATQDATLAELSAQTRAFAEAKGRLYFMLSLWALLRQHNCLGTDATTRLEDTTCGRLLGIFVQQTREGIGLIEQAVLLDR